MSKIDESELQKIVTGRVLPQIYSFSTNTVPNYLKIGDTYRTVEERLEEWRKHYKDLEEISRHKATINDSVFFRDHSVHKYLHQKGFSQLPYDAAKKIYSTEFFENATKYDINDAVDDVIHSYKKTDKYQYYSDIKKVEEYHYTRVENFHPRENQQKVIDNFTKAINKGRTNLLMYAVMRFGKSITSMWCAKSINSKFTVIVSAKADVRYEWKKTVESHIDFKGYRFIDSTNLKSGIKLSNLYGKEFKTGSGEVEFCTNIVLFLTLQDLAGSTKTIKSHHEILKGNNIDLLIIDETHFGARAQVLGKIIAGVKIDESDKQTLKEYREDQDKLPPIDKLESLNSKIKLHLSGTPYRILMGSEFEEKDIIAFVQFRDIYEAKIKWNIDNLDQNEWNNPYYGFPQMIRFAFNPNESSRKLLNQLEGSNPDKLFEPTSIHKSDGYENFLHEHEVIDLLQVLDGTKNDTRMLGLLNSETIKKGKLANHVVMVLPYRASCDALEKLIIKNRTLFKNLSEYNILNISGYNKTLNTSEEIKTEVDKAESQNIKTLTLTVNKMLTGSTVPQWDTMIYLKATESPQEYDQAIFRLQSPWIKKYKDKVGDVVKFDMKPQTLLVDLYPTRMFQLQEKKAYISGVNTENIGNENIEEFIKKELNISPIITLNAEGNKLIEATATNIMDEVRKYANSRTILEDVNEVGVDLKLKAIPEIYYVISNLTELGDKSGLNINPNTGDGKELIGGAENKVSDKNLETKELNNVSEEENKVVSFEKQLRTFYVKVLFFAFLSSSEEKSLTDVINNIDANDDNKRIAKNLGLDKEILVLIRDNINPLVLRSLDYKIQNTDFRSYDNSITPVEHINIAIHKFGRLSEAEIFTPSNIVNKMYDSFDEEFWRNAKDSGILDIASKSGVFAKGFVENALKHGVKPDEIKNNFYSIPTSPAAYEFTRKMYIALGLNIDNIAKNFNSFDIIKLKEEEIMFLLSQNKKFSEISLDDLNDYVNMSGESNNKNMKFTAIVGNPPYDNRTNTNFAESIYHRFFDIALLLNPDFITMIHPAKFLFNGGATPKSWNRKMLNDPHLSIKMYEPDIKKIFPSISATGGICITFWDKQQINGGLNGIFIGYEDLRKILYKAKSEGLDNMISTAGGSPTIRYIDKFGRKRSYFRTSAFFDLKDVFSLKPNHKSMIKIIGLEKGNKRTERFVNLNRLNDPNLKKWKVFVPESNGSGAIGEVAMTPLIGEPILGEPFVGCTESFIQVGHFDSKVEAQNCMKYIKTKFARAMLGTVKVTQHNPKKTWKNVPLQNFTGNSDIDWTKPISEIDQQLYKKYNLEKSEINFVETHVKAME